LVKIISVLVGLVVAAVVAFILILPTFGTLDDSIWTPDPFVAPAMPVAAGLLPLTPGTFAGMGEGGFNGPIGVDVVVDSTGRIDDIIVTLTTETPSFADPAFMIITASILATQSTGVDIVAGATDTSVAFIAAIEDALTQAGVSLADLRAGPAGGAATPGNFMAGTFTGVGSGGFNGDIHVAVTFSDTAITGLEVVHSLETPSFADPAFAHLIGAVLAAQTYQVDTFTGATDTSVAFLGAVQDAMEQSAAGAPAPPPPPPPPELPTIEEIDVTMEHVALAGLNPGTFLGTGYGGFAGDVLVYVTFSETAITDIVVGYHNETPSFALMTFGPMTDAVMAAQSTEVDMITGATESSIAFLRAIADATRQSIAGATPVEMPEADESEEAEEDEPADEPEEAAAADEDDADDEAPAAAAGRFTPGTFTASAEGYLGPIAVSVVFDADRIVSITITSHQETEMFFNFVVPSFTDAIIAAQDTAGIDTVAGATYTAEAIRQAVANTINQASN